MLQRRETVEIAPAPPKLSWVDHPDDTVRQATRDAMLAFATLGISRFWTTTAYRRRLWSSVVIDGQRLAYTGTPMDLALPAIFAVLGAVLVFVFAYDRIADLFGMRDGFRLPTFAELGGQRLFYLIPLLTLIGMARYRARNFLLNRLVLAASSGRMTGRPVWFGPRHLVTTLAIGPTLGWILPARSVWLTSVLVRETEIAGHRLSFEPRCGALYRAFALSWLGVAAVYLAMNVALAIIAGSKIVTAVETRSLPAFTLGEWATVLLIVSLAVGAIAALSAAYMARETQLLWAMTSWRGLRFRFEMTRLAYLRLVFANAALLAFTLGALKQVAVSRMLKAHTLALRIEPDDGDEPARLPARRDAVSV
jgi:uncharacterized membrane protein YjgN (DUF898 family)